jgi:hypothetical protein
MPGQTSNELHTLDYDNIPLQKIQLLPIIFDGDMFELLPIHSNAHNPSQMQNMDRKDNGHAWNKLVTTNIKNSFGLSFKKARCLGHLWCVQDDCENSLCSATHNETFWCGECTHILVFNQMTMIPSSSSFTCKFCHSLPFCVVDCIG